ncbi:MAG: succinylglutamate desuccinylase/aspartoacylase family protein [Wenzhouxiangella sp.]|nr:succinylglutamate desuccinylase/aspartoacylase family protein [Wenzhouxiangella sp.]MCH8478880.1 M14 family metallopeptidase [Wenzhouxiangella sp.]TVR97065.1 MAG: peptidase M14 [Wenzhouxiangellaceae bacterium]
MKPVILDHLPDALLDQPASELHRHLDGPTLIHLPGRRPQPLFVSVLQHGNETSGWEAIRRLLKSRYQRDPLPRSLVLMIGNVRAAARGQRRLADQPDFNRCWPGAHGQRTIWHQLFGEITEHVRRLKPFASIDVHNNTGQNPHYAAVNRIEPQRLQLAARFSRTVIYFTEPLGVQSLAFGEFCPAVTLECGLAAETDGTDHAMAYVDGILNLDELSARMPAPEHLELYHMIATVTVREDIDFGFSAQAADLRFQPDLDRLNFREMPPGTRLARTVNGHGLPLIARSHDGRDLTSDCFAFADGQVVTRRPLMPAMLTTDESIVRQDCLCYLMERIGLDRPGEGRLDDDGSELPETLP